MMKNKKMTTKTNGSSSSSSSSTPPIFSNPLSNQIQNVVDGQMLLRHSRSCTTIHNDNNKENFNNNILATSSSSSSLQMLKSKSLSTLKPSSLKLCMQINDAALPLSLDISNRNIWDYSGSIDAAPASSWSTLPNKSLMCKPLPIDIGRCTCIIVKEPAAAAGGTFFSLYTYEGEGRQNRKLAVAHHKRSHSGRSHFTIALNLKGLLSISNNSSSSDHHTFLGTVTANLTGSKYHIWDQGYRHNSHLKVKQQPKAPLAVVEYVPTIATCVGSHRSMKAYLPKHQSMSFKNTTQVQHIKGLPINWEGKLDNVHQLFSRVPLYNKNSKQFELDFRDKGRTGLRIQKSVKNFQLTLEENGSQTILQLGRVGKTKFVMDYRYPLTGYQAFCMCLASIDAKLCCMV